MKQKECPSCAMQISVNSKVCPVCGYEFAPRATGLKWAAFILALLFLLYLFFF